MRDPSIGRPPLLRNHFFQARCICWRGTQNHDYFTNICFISSIVKFDIYKCDKVCVCVCVHARVWRRKEKFKFSLKKKEKKKKKGGGKKIMAQWLKYRSFQAESQWFKPGPGKQFFLSPPFFFHFFSFFYNNPPPFPPLFPSFSLFFSPSNSDTAETF